MGDPICRIRNSPMYMMLVVELKNELVGVIQGSIKLVAVQGHPPNNFGKGRTCPWPKGITPSPKKRDWLKPCEKARRMVHFQGCGLCIYGNRKDNQASVSLFRNKFCYTKFRTPTVLVNPVNHHCFQVSSNIEIARLKVDQAVYLYRRFMGSTEFFPNDIGNILRNKLSLGT
ncbi:hypothetical protein ACSQ67_011907 [Phaseolus vulgaris]